MVNGSEGTALGPPKAPRRGRVSPARPACYWFGSAGVPGAGSIPTATRRCSISGDFSARATSAFKDVRRVALVREASRRTIGEFVETWLLTKDPQWKPGAFSTVKVYFLNEMDEGLSSELGVR